MRPQSQAKAAPRLRPRVARRRAAARDRIVAAAAALFAAAGPDSVRLDVVAERADVARGTLYSHFRTKDALLRAIVEPVLETAAREAAAVERLPAREAVDRLLALYLRLWKDDPDALRIAYKAQGAPLGDAGALHARFLQGVMKVFARAHRAGALRAGDPALAGHVLRQVAVPLLELYEGREDAADLFRESMRGLLLRPGRPPRGASARAS